MKTLFNKKRVKISYDENKGKEIIVMKLIINYFATDYEIHFELFKQMIPEEENDSQLINLYTINKEKSKLDKEIFNLIDEPITQFGHIHDHDI